MINSEQQPLALFLCVCVERVRQQPYEAIENIARNTTKAVDFLRAPASELRFKKCEP